MNLKKGYNLNENIKTVVSVNVIIIFFLSKNFL